MRTMIRKSMVSRVGWDGLSRGVSTMQFSTLFSRIETSKDAGKTLFASFHGFMPDIKHGSQMRRMTSLTDEMRNSFHRLCSLAHFRTGAFTIRSNPPPPRPEGTLSSPPPGVPHTRPFVIAPLAAKTPSRLMSKLISRKPRGSCSR